jgi:hypothetical protein
MFLRSFRILYYAFSPSNVVAADGASQQNEQVHLHAQRKALQDFKNHMLILVAFHA